MLNRCVPFGNQLPLKDLHSNRLATVSNQLCVQLSGEGRHSARNVVGHSNSRTAFALRGETNRQGPLVVRELSWR